MNKTLALFDFDGTLTRKDSLIEFIRFAQGDIPFAGGMIQLSPMLIAYKLKLIRNDKAKEKMISFFFKNTDEVKFRQLASEYSLREIDKIVKRKALEKLVWHQKNNHRVVVVSASMECWLKPWCDKNNLELISTKLKFSNGAFTGKFVTKNCYGIEKVNRITDYLNLDDYDEVYAYGDSKGDKEMLELANHQYFRCF